MFICRNAEGVHAYLLKCRRGTCSSVRMLKGCMVNKRLGTTAKPIENLLELSIVHYSRVSYFFRLV